MLDERIFAVAVVGPTASGKTSLAIRLAERMDGEIISMDSMQIYKEFVLGTAKPTEEEMQRVPHHMVDIRHIDEPYSAADYAADALTAAREIASREKAVILCGGTGLYLEALRTGRHEDTPDVSDTDFRKSMLPLTETEEGRQALWDRLLRVDPVSAEKIHKNNVRRVLRALELYEKTGIPKSEWDKKAPSASKDIEVLPILLTYHSREQLYDRINRRVDIMVEKGLVEEAEALYKDGVLTPDTTAGQAIGYKEFIPYFEGKCTKTEAIDALKTATRRYAKRQLTWFRSTAGTLTLHADQEDGTLKKEEALLSDALALIAGTPRVL